MKEKSAALVLSNQLTFPLYAASNKLMRRYNEFLSYLGLTYTQYIVMATLWKKEDINMKELGETLWLKSNTLTPLLKKLSAKGYINVIKNKNDSRNLVISLTDEGSKLNEKAINVPPNIIKRSNLSDEEIRSFLKILYRILDEDDSDLY